MASVQAFGCVCADADTARNPVEDIIVQNQKPTKWNGRKLDIGVYKAGKLLVMQKDVPVGGHAEFMLQPKLFFAVVHKMYARHVVRKIFTSLEIISALTECDLHEYENGVIVSLKPNQVDWNNLKYRFSAEHIA